MSVWQKSDCWSGQGKGGENYSGRLHSPVPAEGAGGPWLHYISYVEETSDGIPLLDDWAGELWNLILDLPLTYSEKSLSQIPRSGVQSYKKTVWNTPVVLCTANCVGEELKPIRRS